LLAKDTYFCEMEKVVHFKNIPVSYTDQGKGTAVVLLHGFLENKNMWAPFIPDISSKYRVLALDLLGHGNTPALGYIHSMEDMAALIYTVVHSLRLRRIVLIGHSMGGYAALAFLKQHPEMVKGLCLVNSTPFGDSERRLALRAKMIRILNKDNYSQIVKTLVEGLFNQETLASHHTAIQSAKQDALKVPLQSFIATQKGMMERENLSSLFAAFKGHKLVVLGKKDALIDPITFTKFLQTQNISFEILPDGHMSHLENTTQLHLLITSFLKNCS